MSLARVKVWIPGDVLTAADLNSEFNNVLNNPITLISPTTGPINFNLQANTNFVLENVATTPTAATSGRIVYDTAIGLPKVDQGTIVRSIPLVLATQLSTGSILVFTSSGGFATIANGSSGQVLTVSSSNTSPAFAAASAGSATFDPTTNAQFYEEFYGTNTSTPSNVGQFTFMNSWGLFFGANAVTLNSTDYAGSKGTLRITSQGSNASICSFGSTASATAQPAPFVYTTDHPTLITRFMSATSGATTIQLFNGCSTLVLTSTTVTVGDAFYFYSSVSTGAVKGVTRAGGAETISSGLGVTATAFHTYKAVVTSSQIDWYVDGVLSTSNTTNIPTAAMGPMICGSAVSSGGFVIDYMYITSTR